MTGNATMFTLNPTELWTQLSNPHLWIVVSLATTFGSLGGLAQRLTDVAPVGNTTPTLARKALEGLTGAIAAIGILLVAEPTEGIEFIALTLIAGYAGRGVLQRLTDRVTALVALQDTKVALQEARSDVRTLLTIESEAPGLRPLPTNGNAELNVTTARNAVITNLRARYYPSETRNPS